jgi:hypothetical protein
MSGMFVLQGDGGLVEMTEQPYGTEAMLQELLAKYPNLLAGDQIDAAAPRRWLLVSREMGVPDEEDGGDRWSLDHLFLDQDAIPTLVEVKRSSDTRIRREVVGQMLDYAANAVVYWPVETIRAKFEQACGSRGDDPAAVLGAFLGAGADAEQFWQRAKTNLQAGKVRLVFVADVIPPELKRVVEFLNGQMDPAEVLAVEVRQYVGQGLKTLVPRVIGQTVEAERKKGGPAAGKREWDDATFLEEVRSRRGEGEYRAAAGVLDWAKRAGLRLGFGKGAKVGWAYPMLGHAGGEYHTVWVSTDGSLTVPFKAIMAAGPFAAEAKRAELHDRLSAIPGVSVPEAMLARHPNLPLAAFGDPLKLEQLLAVLNWYLDVVRAG